LKKALVLALLLAASPAHAAFTTQEAMQIEHIRVNVIGKLASALQQFTFALQRNQDTLGMRRAAILNTNTAMRKSMNGLGKLVDVVSPANFQFPDPETRTSRVAAAWADFNQAIVYIDRASAALSEATGANMQSAKNNWLLNAKAAILAIDRTLPYTNPRPASYPALIGPHGDYNMTQALLARAAEYHLDIISFAFGAYGQGATPPTANWYSLLQSSYQNYEMYGDGLAIMAGVGQTNLSQFWRVLNYQKRLTDVPSASSRYRAILMAITVPPSPELAAVINRVGESWFAMDKAVWEMLVFLNCTQVKDPQGCAAGQVNQGGKE
jgi:hypothetical protein